MGPIGEPNDTVNTDSRSRRHPDRQRLPGHVRPPDRPGHLPAQRRPRPLPRHHQHQPHRRVRPGHLGRPAQPRPVRRHPVPGELRPAHRRRHLQPGDHRRRHQRPDPGRASRSSSRPATRSPRLPPTSPRRSLPMRPRPRSIPVSGFAGRPGRRQRHGHRVDHRARRQRPDPDLDLSQTAPRSSCPTTRRSRSRGGRTTPTPRSPTAPRSGSTRGSRPFTGSFRPVSPLNQLVSPVDQRQLDPPGPVEPDPADGHPDRLVGEHHARRRQHAADLRQPARSELQRNQPARPPTSMRPRLRYRWRNGPFTGPFSQDTLPLILPGPHVVEHPSVPGAAGHRRQPGAQRHGQRDRRDVRPRHEPDHDHAGDHPADHGPGRADHRAVHDHCRTRRAPTPTRSTRGPTGSGSRPRRSAAPTRSRSPRRSPTRTATCSTPTSTPASTCSKGTVVRPDCRPVTYNVAARAGARFPPTARRSSRP